MFDKIQQAYDSCVFDFRRFATPSDPLRHLFPQWIDYYRLKWAIVRVLQPLSIFEIGVRYGYSAITFLDARPEAHYVGVDLDTDSFGGTKGAIDWAQKITAGYAAEYLVADTQKMLCFPGGMYDLIHVDGQQDGDGTYHDLELALRQGRWVLVDGYFWSKDNFNASNEFLLRNKGQFEFYMVLPGYAGELLIKTKVGSDGFCGKPSCESSEALRECYTSEYYLTDCGGYDEFKRGRFLDEPRLRAVAALAELRPGGRVLDLGCGRGELARHFAAQDCSVTAIDYSSDSIALAEKCVSGDAALQGRVQFHADSVCNPGLYEGQYDVAIAADLVEHLSPAELEAFYGLVAGHLCPEGLLIVHTSPNLWHYRYEYARGGALPAPSARGSRPIPARITSS